jgi:uncharacterized protein
MNKLKTYLLLCILSISHSLFAQDIPQRPNPPRLVNDFVGMLNGSEREQLEQKLRGYADSTSTQIAVVVIKSVKPYDASEYATKLIQQWGVGQKGKNNGIALLWATDDRKVFIATGYGMEGSLPDAICKRIVNLQLIPSFKQKAWYQGLDAATTEMMKRASGEYVNEKQGQSDDDGSGIVFLVILIIIFIVIIIFWIISKRGGGNNHGGGYRQHYDPFPYITLSNWGSSSGSGWGNNSGGGGGGFDFGGFGGGDSGGGGAGGDY